MNIPMSRRVIWSLVQAMVALTVLGLLTAAMVAVVLALPGLFEGLTQKRSSLQPLTAWWWHA